MQLRLFFPIIKKITKIFILFLGTLALILSIGAFTSIPYHMRVWLGTHQCNNTFTPEYIVMLGGGGMPSEGNLMRLYYTAEMANCFEDAIVIIAHPFDSIVKAKMACELQIRGIDSLRIQYAHIGTNTRSQVLGIADTFHKCIHSQIVVITATEQMQRSVLSFRKAGFTNVTGVPAMQNDMHTGLLYKSRKIGGKALVPDIGDNLALRYNFWNYLVMEIQCLREFCALGYYWLNGWI